MSQHNWEPCKCSMGSACLILANSPYLGCLSISYGQHLLSNNRKHFNINAIELIEAAPSSRLGKTREETTHHLDTEVIVGVNLHIR